MKSYALFQEYIWLVNTIHRAGRITLEEINRKWVRTDNSDEAHLYEVSDTHRCSNEQAIEKHEFSHQIVIVKVP